MMLKISFKRQRACQYEINTMKKSAGCAGHCKWMTLTMMVQDQKIKAFSQHESSEQVCEFAYNFIM